VEDDGAVTGVPVNAVADVIKNFIKMVNNPEVFIPTVYLAPEVLEYDGKKVVYIHVPPSSEVHRYKKVIYDRVDDSDVKITATGQIAQMYIRKQHIFTEKKVYPYVRDEHLRFDILPRIRQLAVNRYKDHPWRLLSDAELLQSAGLVGEDLETGAKGYNLYRYGKLYSGEVPQLIDGDVFRIVVPLDDNYSFDAQIKAQKKAQIKAQIKAQSKRKNSNALVASAVKDYIEGHPEATQTEIAEAVGKSRRTVQNVIAELRKKGLLKREGARMNGRWVVKK
jgi:predicted HTH transcriptional regulator